jgi:hypothetical protein
MFTLLLFFPCCRFAVNFQCGKDAESDDIAFHFNPRFNEGVTVRNTRQGGEWGGEERDQNDFPFEQEDRFELAFVMLPHGIRVSSVDCLPWFIIM